MAAPPKTSVYLYIGPSALTAAISPALSAMASLRLCSRIVAGCVALWVPASYTTEWWWWTRPNGTTYFAVSTSGRLWLARQSATLAAALPGYSIDSSDWGQLKLIRIKDGGVVHVESTNPTGGCSR